MKFGVIYSATIFGNRFESGLQSLSDMDPKILKHGRGVWRKSKESARTKQRDYEKGLTVRAHGKWVALLTKKQVREFFAEFGFEYNTLCQTGGALGMPGCGYNMAPAISFDSRMWDNAIVNVYVTPQPEIEVKGGESCTDKNCKAIERAMECLFD